jgi:hypothetical protein
MFPTITSGPVLPVHEAPPGRIVNVPEPPDALGNVPIWNRYALPTTAENVAVDCVPQPSSLQANAGAVGQALPAKTAMRVSTVVPPHVDSVNGPVAGAVHVNHTSWLNATPPKVVQTFDCPSVPCVAVALLKGKLVPPDTNVGEVHESEPWPRACVEIEAKDIADAARESSLFMLAPGGEC